MERNALVCNLATTASATSLEFCSNALCSHPRMSHAARSDTVTPAQSAVGTKAGCHSVARNERANRPQERVASLTRLSESIQNL